VGNLLHAIAVAVGFHRHFRPDSRALEVLFEFGRGLTEHCADDVKDPGYPHHGGNEFLTRGVFPNILLLSVNARAGAVDGGDRRCPGRGVYLFDAVAAQTAHAQAGMRSRAGGFRVKRGKRPGVVSSAGRPKRDGGESDRRRAGGL